MLQVKRSQCLEDVQWHRKFDLETLSNDGQGLGDWVRKGINIKWVLEVYRLC